MIAGHNNGSKCIAELSVLSLNEINFVCLFTDSKY